MMEELIRRLDRLAGTLRALRDPIHAFDRDLADGVDLAASEADSLRALVSKSGRRGGDPESTGRQDRTEPGDK
jgi:hypothetical protein